MPFMGMPLGHNEGSPFNIPHMAKRAGACYVARWTQLHIRRFSYALTDALNLPGFSMIEVISPCLMYYASNGSAGAKIDRLEYLNEYSVIKNGEPTENLDIIKNEKIIVGKFTAKVRE
jgi:2-oxoglutarate ferredoxin oxidoreductase subunit beta